jgi:hypothetical protein
MDIGLFFKRTYTIFGGKWRDHDTSINGDRTFTVDLPELELARSQFRTYVNDQGLQF